MFQSALANLNMLTDSTYRSGVPIANATVPPAGSSRLSRSSDGRGSLRGVPGVGGGGAAAGFHNSGSSSNVLMNVSSPLFSIKQSNLECRLFLIIEWIQEE